MPAGRARPKHFPEGTLLSFVALAINILTTVFGDGLPESLTARQVVYGLLLVSCFFTLDYFGKTDIIVSIDKLEVKICCDGFYS